MTTYTGQNGTVKDGSNAVAEVRNFEVSQSADVVEDTVMGDSWKTNKATLKSWSGSVSCYYDNTDTTGQNVFAVGDTVTFRGYPSADTSGNIELGGSGIVTSRVIRSAHDGMVELDLELTGTGALTETDVA